VLLIDYCIPEDHTHIVSLGLSEGENQCVVEISPHVLRLNVGEENVAVDCKSNSQTKAFPG
jgi:hypothetical protein